jgi:hypothetical protein
MRRFLKQMMAVGSIAVLITVAVPASVLACKTAGAFTHVGVVSVVDTKALTLTLNDAESGEQIVFAATAKLLKGIKPGHELVIGYTEQKGKLTAVRIRS